MLVELIARHLPSDGRIEDELAILSTQLPAKRAELQRRLVVVDAFLQLDRQSVAAADAAAAELGLTRRTFYRLLAKVREFGAVRALSPGYRNVARRSQTRGGFSDEIEAMLQTRLLAAPEARVSDIAKFIKAGCVDRKIEYPGDTAIRRRIQALRSSGKLVNDNAVVGARIAVDQSALSLHLESGSPAVVTLIIDQESKLILSSAVSVPDDGGIGLQTAVWRFRQRLSQLPVHALAGHLEEVTWVVPEGLDWLCEANRCGMSKPKRARVLAIGNDPRRHGDAIVRLLGDRLGPYEFRRYSTELSQSSVRSHLWDDLEGAERLIDACVENWNDRILSLRAETESGGSKADQRRKAALSDEVQGLFAPVFEAIEDRYAAVRR
jgi:hypothetical protein